MENQKKPKEAQVELLIEKPERLTIGNSSKLSDENSKLNDNRQYRYSSLNLFSFFYKRY